MALTLNHPLIKEHTIEVTAPNVSTTVVVRLPFRCKVVKVGAALGAAITVAPLTVTSAIIPATADAAAPGAGTTVTYPTLSISNTNSAAGSGNNVVPTANNTGNEDDILTFVPAGATGASTAVTYYAVLQTV